jgi:hypothetical protein
MIQSPLKHFKIVGWSVVVLVFALAGLVFARLSTQGYTEFSSVDLPGIVNISVQLFAIINPFSALPTFLIFTDSMAGLTGGR